VDLGKLTQGERLIVGGAVAYLVALFLPWYGVTVFTGLRLDNIGWDYVLGGVVPLVLVGAAAALTLVPSLRPSAISEDLPPPVRDLRRDAAMVAALIVLLRSAIDDQGLERRYGLFLALAATVLVTVGAFLSPAPSDAAPRS
jgi:peptidoglycan/LPS O-acetylase OafA/YrhL